MGTQWYALGETQGFLWRPDFIAGHSGIDLGTGIGEPITAPFDGVVDHSKEPWGGQINEYLTDSRGNKEVLSWLHTSQEVASGPVHAGQLIGYSGTPPLTGPNAFKYGNGPHIHFEETMGTKAPYVSGYSPGINPSATSYPVTPQPTLNQLKSGGEGGILGGRSAGITGTTAFGPGQNTSGLTTMAGDTAGTSGVSLPFDVQVHFDMSTWKNPLTRLAWGILGGIIVIISFNNLLGALGLPDFQSVVKKQIEQTKQMVESSAKVAAVAA